MTLPGINLLRSITKTDIIKCLSAFYLCGKHPNKYPETLFDILENIFYNGEITLQPSEEMRFIVSNGLDSPIQHNKD